MLSVLTPLIGGIGLFLLGMALMTDSLKALAGDSLRQWLGRFTGSPTKAMFSGIGFTMIVQSSTATTLATIGFVSAGVLSFVQAIGVIIGANIGTTSTGWLVAFLGLKFSITAFSLPMIGAGAMMKLLGSEKVAQLGLALAGFGLLFLGIDFLQDAMSGLAKQVDLSAWSNDSLSTRFILVIIGIVMTILLQSSTAAVTATLAALASGAIDLPQALALVIGQNIGTVATAVLASFGASTNAKRTASVHVIFNVVTAVVAFFGLMPLTLWLVKSGIATWEDTLIIAGFHTAFSLMGAMMFMPFTRQLQTFIEKLLPQKEAVQTLDESLFSIPALAIASAKALLCQSLAQIYTSVIKASQGELSGASINVGVLDETLIHVEDYLKKMPVPQAKNDQQHLTDLLRLVVYGRVIREDLLHAHLLDLLRAEFLGDNAPILGYFKELTAHLSHLPTDGIEREFVARFVAFGDSLKAQKEDVRADILEQNATHNNTASHALEMIIAQRWLDHFIKHTIKAVMLLEANT